MDSRSCLDRNVGLLPGTLLLGTLLLFALPGAALDAGPSPGKPDPVNRDQAKMMELWAEYSTPGKHHEGLKAMIGEWDYKAEVVAPGMEATDLGTSSCRWVVPDLWIGCESTGTFLGQPHFGFNLYGFDKFKKNFVYAWIDNSSTALHTATGVVVDPTGKVEVTYGTLDEFLTGEHDKPLRVVRRWAGADRYTIDVWDLGMGETGQVVLKFSFSRKKEAK